MKKLFPWAALLSLGVVRALAVAPVAVADGGEDVEKQVAALVAGPQVTIVHLWAPWCGNCKNEMRPDGWAKFVAANPAVKIVFVNVWHKGQDAAPKLAAAGLAGGEAGATGAAPGNFLALTHPNASNARGEKLEKFLGMPVQWVPTTWVYRDGKLRYALNYGEVRFPMLQQMVDDAAAKW
jgi:thiol-disulfide isomerase/thioredoxin